MEIDELENFSSRKYSVYDDMRGVNRWSPKVVMNPGFNSLERNLEEFCVECNHTNCTCQKHSHDKGEE